MLIPASILPFQRRGANSLSVGANSTDQTIVSAAANTNGLLIRTLYMIAGGSVAVELRVNGNLVFSCFNSGTFNLIGQPFFVPAGQSLSFYSANSSGSCSITWDAVP